MVFYENTIDSKKAFEGRIINVRVDKIRTKDGGESFREVVEHSGGVAIAALTNDNELVLIRQFRKPAEQVILEIPAGKIEKGEMPEATAARELKEETGYTAAKMTHIFTFYSSPGYSSEKIHLYLAEEIELGEASPDENEHLETVTYDFDTLSKMIENGEIIDGKTIVAIQAILLMRKK